MTAYVKSRLRPIVGKRSSGAHGKLKIIFRTKEGTINIWKLFSGKIIFSREKIAKSMYILDNKNLTTKLIWRAHVFLKDSSEDSKMCDI